MKFNPYVSVYLISIVVANLLVSYFGPKAAIFIAFLFIGLDLSIRDQLHDSWNKQNLVLKMALLIGSGSLITVILNYQAMQIAIASSAAFGVAAIGDAIVYHTLKQRDFFIRSNGSNLAGAALDSMIFPVIAFGWPPMWFIVIGQFAAKVIGGMFWSLLLEKFYIYRLNANDPRTN